MAKPLTEWYCDECGESITDTGKAMVVARNDDDLLLSDFLLVHKSMEGKHCDPGARGDFGSSWELNDLLGPTGLAWLLALLSPGPFRGEARNRIVDLDKFVDLVRRLQTPYYEEARKRFPERAVIDDMAGANEVWPYTPAVLKRIADGEVGRG